MNGNFFFSPIKGGGQSKTFVKSDFFLSENKRHGELLIVYPDARVVIYFNLIIYISKLAHSKHSNSESSKITYYHSAQWIIYNGGAGLGIFSVILNWVRFFLVMSVLQFYKWWRNREMALTIWAAVQSFVFSEATKYSSIAI